MRVARYRQIYDRLRAQILAGEYRPGDRLPTEMQLAALHGVSRVTSAAALAALARDGLVQRAPRRGTVVNALAAPTDAPGRPLIAWIQPNIDPAFGLDLLRGVEHATRRAGYNLLLHLTGTSRREEERAIRDAVAAGAAGLALFLQDGATYNDEVLRLMLDGFPLVLVDRYLRGLECATVQSDNIAAAREVAGELVAAGHRQICALIFPPKDTSTIEDRVEGYTQALAAAGIPLDRSLLYVEGQLREAVLPWQMPDGAVERFAAYLRRRREITAVFATNAQLALLAVRAAERLELDIPADLSVAAVDDVQAFPLSAPRLTCALQPAFDLGTMAVALLREQLAGQPRRQVMLPARLERAGSIAPPRAALVSGH